MRLALSILVLLVSVASANAQDRAEMSYEETVKQLQDDVSEIYARIKPTSDIPPKDAFQELAGPLTIYNEPTPDGKYDVLPQGEAIFYAQPFNDHYWVVAAGKYPDGLMGYWATSSDVQLVGLKPRGDPYLPRWPPKPVMENIREILPTPAELIAEAQRLREKRRDNPFIEIGGFSIVLSAQPALELSFVFK